MICWDQSCLQASGRADSHLACNSLCRNTPGCIPRGKLCERQCGDFANAFFVVCVFFSPDVQSNSFISGLFDYVSVACSLPALLPLSASEDSAEGIRLSAA